MAVAIALIVRLLLVALFLPFSALDKLRNFGRAVSDAGAIGIGVGGARALVLTGFAVEVVMSLGVLTGVADRMAAAVLAAYCIATALLYKRFWSGRDVVPGAPDRRRDLFWDFWKNLAVAGGFLLITFGTGAQGVEAFLAAPFSSTHPYGEASR